MKRADEECCKAQFDAFLRKFFSSTEVTWKEVARQDEPPDFYLLLDNARFAIEVTTLVEKVLVGRTLPLPPAVISSILREFVDDVETTAKAEGYLHGCYLVSFPTPIDNFAIVRGEIREGLLDFIRDTGGLEGSPLKVVFERITPSQRPQQCGIKKVTNKPNRVTVGGPVWIKWEDDAAIDLCSLLNRSLNTKVNKLRNIAVPKILLLRDEYVFATPEMYGECIPQIQTLSFFHTVFVVQGYKRGFILHSQHSDWSKQQLVICTAAG